ncbi:lipopolysaccharide biosynthesis protein [Micromonospora orduensis]|uniref:Lipopolysaccharide biosynthesis protein n=1 Tax=Micromonospora orduensis TaxID=1420891 RepID=A0A5C4QLA1_9ACTN|nr:lipopolysaccharide biosynthesis protein [Micromonospora orduensis]TNH27621.1 lipopolysaccharide biosynthesis protein [Micromonospora orduensis]
MSSGVAERTRRAGPAGASRSRRLISGVTTALLSRAAGLVVPIVLVPVTLPYFGNDLYGLWMAVASLAGMAAFADLGLGSGLMTKLAPCYAHGDAVRARRYVSNAYLTLTVLAVALTALLWLTAGAVPWTALFNVTGQVTPEQTRMIALICLTAFVLNVPLSLIARVQYAYQQVGRSNVWQSAGNLAALAVVLGVVWAELSPLLVVAVSVATPLVVNLLNTLWFFGRQEPGIRPTPRAVDAAAALELTRLSGLFFVLTVVIAVATNADTLIIAHALGLSAVAGYAVPAKLMSQLGQLVVLVNVPLWPANGEALAQGHLDWVRRTTRRMTVLSVLAAGLPAAALVAFGDRLFAAWLPVPMDDDRWLLAGLGVWWLLQAALSPRFMVQNADGVIVPQLVGWAAFLVLSALGKWYAADRLGVAAVPWVGALGYALTVAPAALYGYRRTLRRHRRPATDQEGVVAHAVR